MCAIILSYNTYKCNKQPQKRKGKGEKMTEEGKRLSSNEEICIYGYELAFFRDVFMSSLKGEPSDYERGKIDLYNELIQNAIERFEFLETENKK